MKGLYILCFMFILGNSKYCNSPKGIVCCSGYKEREPKGDDCIPCENGFFGPNCVFPCQFPAYGEECQFTCSCSKELCDHVHGCNDIKGSNTTSLIFSTTSDFQQQTDHDRGTRKKFSGVVTAVICLTSVAGLFLVLYFGLRIFMIKYKSVQRSVSSAV